MTPKIPVLNKDRVVRRNNTTMASLSIASLIAFFSEEKKSIERGENHYRSNHVECFTYCQGSLRGEVHASMKKKVYKVTIHLDERNGIKSTECECPRGAFKCSHAAALFIHGIHNLSRTDIECQWKKKKSVTSIQAVSEMSPPSKQYCPLSRQPTKEDRAPLYEDLNAYGKFTGLYWLMSPEPAQPHLPIETVDDIYSEEFLQIEGLENQLGCLIERARVNGAITETINQLTIGQRDNPCWHLIRKGRLTASNFGCVMNAKRATPSLIKRLLGEYDISRVKAVTWGVNNEEEGSKAFTRLTGQKVTESGIWLDTSGVLGASPDGLAGDDAVIEIKCPYTQRNMMIADAVLEGKFCLGRSQNGTYFLKKEHVYWHQVQGQIYLTKRKLCYFVVWTTKDVVILIIERDSSWEKNLDTMKDFYYHHIFPKIIEGEL